METEKRKKFLVDFSYITIVGILIFLAAKFLIGYLLPFVIATVIAFLMQKPAEVVSDRLHIKKQIIAAVFSVAVYFVIAIALVFLIYRLTVALGFFSSTLPELFDKAVILFDSLNGKISNIFSDNYNPHLKGFWNSILERSADFLSGFVSLLLTGIAKGTPSFLFSSVVALVASCYIAKDFDRLIRFVKEIIGQRMAKNAVKIKSILLESVFKLLKGYLILSVLTYFEILIGLLVLRVKYAYLIALFVALVDILPVLGTGTVLIPWAVVSALLGDISLGIGLAVLYVLVVLVRNFSEPKIIGTQMGINPLFTLIAMFVGLKLFGVVGLFAFPVILIVVIKYYRE